MSCSKLVSSYLNIKIGSINAAGSLRANIVEYVTAFNKLKLHILCVQDTGKFSASYITNNANITVFTHAPPYDDEAGGLCFLVSNTISSCFSISPQVCRRAQTAVVKCPFPLTIHNVYMQQNNKLVGDMINNIKLDANSIILGDLNSTPSPCLDRVSSIGKAKGPTYPVLNLIKKGWCDSFRTTMHPDSIRFTRWGTTHTKSGINISAARLDHILCHKNLIKYVEECSIVEDRIVPSDHRIVWIQLKGNSIASHSQTPFTYRQNIHDKSQWHNFTKALTKNPLLSHIDANSSLDEFRNKITDVFDRIFPTKSYTKYDPIHYIHSHPEYIALKKIKKQAFKLQRVVKSRGLDLEVEWYDVEEELQVIEQCIGELAPKGAKAVALWLHKAEDRIGKKLRCVIRKINKEKCVQLMEKLLPFIDQNGHNVFKLFRKMSNNLINCIFEGDEAHIDPPVIRDKLVQKWTDIFATKTKPTEKFKQFLITLPVPQSPPPQPNFSPENIKRILSTKSPTSPGHSKISWKMIDAAPIEYIERLSVAYKELYDQNNKPDYWRIGNTVLLPKPDTPPTADGFRPITLLSVEYKLYSQILADCITGWLVNNDVIPEWQNGALKNRGCDTSLWQFLSTIYDARVHNKQLHAIYIDFKKAYDSVEHWVFDEIFEHLGAGHLGDVICGMLRESYTHLKINNEIIDDKIPFNKGTKQGDVLSPILFLLFMSPLMHFIKQNCKGYHNTTSNVKFIGSAIMDDLLVVSDSVEDSKKAVDIIKDFSAATGMEINADKSAYAWLNCSTDFIPKIGNKEFRLLGSSKHYKYLGVLISLDLNWKPQQEALRNSMYAVTDMICSKFYLSGYWMVRLLQSMVYSICGYRMQVILFDKEFTQSLQYALFSKINKACKLYNQVPPEAWCTIFNLPLLRDYNYQRYITSLNRVALSSDENCSFIQKLFVESYPRQSGNWPHPELVCKTVGVRPIFTNTHNPIPSTLTRVDLTLPCHSRTVFVDGSLFPSVPPRMAAAVWDSKLDFSFTCHVNGPISSTEAELQGIYKALLKYKLTNYLEIVSDSKNAIELITNLSTPSFNLKKHPSHVTLKAIKQLIAGKTVLTFGDHKLKSAWEYICFTHVFSHVKIDSTEYKDMKEKFKDKLEFYLNGNHKVDILAKRDNTLPSLPHPIRANWYCDSMGFVDITNNVIPCISKHLKNIATESARWSWLAKQPTKANRILNSSVDFNTTVEIIRNPKVSDRAIGLFAFKNLMSILPTKHSVPHNIKRMSKVRQKVYSDSVCKSCRDKGLSPVESHDHIFSECYDAFPSHQLLAHNILMIINTEINCNLSSLPQELDFGGPQGASGPEKRVEVGCECTRGWWRRGFIPVKLKKWLSGFGTTKQVNNALFQISTVIHKTNRVLWNERCLHLFAEYKQHRTHS